MGQPWGCYASHRQRAGSAGSGGAAAAADPAAADPGSAFSSFERCARRIHAFLTWKLRHGYFEFNSGCYFPLTLAALLNLVDFADDDGIREMCVQRGRGAGPGGLNRE